VNPGAAGKPRFHDMPSVCVLSWDSERLEFAFDEKVLEWRRGG